MAYIAILLSHFLEFNIFYKIDPHFLPVCDVFMTGFDVPMIVWSCWDIVDFIACGFYEETHGQTGMVYIAQGISFIEYSMIDCFNLDFLWLYLFLFHISCLQQASGGGREIFYINCVYLKVTQWASGSNRDLNLGLWASSLANDEKNHSGFQLTWEMIQSIVIAE